jgi:hypothetical protein
MSVKKSLSLSLAIIFVFWMFLLFGPNGNYGKFMNQALVVPNAHAITSTANVLLTGTILPYLTFTLSGATASFGNITPGTSTCANGASGTETDVTTNSSNGYTLAMNDSSPLGQSAMIHGDGATYIPDFTTGTFATPAVFAGYGVGVSLYAGTQKEAGWGTGTTDCDTSFDKWAGVPSAATVAHTVTGYTVAADKSYWGWIVKVANTQKTGIYSGNVLMTVTTVLS